jgi:hypothetical protein
MVTGSPELDSRAGPVFVIKVYAPVILSVGLIGSLGSGWVVGRLLFDLPMALAVAFLLSLARVDVRDRRIRYRRFFKWVNLDPAEIVSSGATWPPFIGYIRLSRYLFPWRKLYFVLDRNRASNPFRRDYALLNFLAECRHPKA